MIWVTKQEILLAHTMLIKQFGGLDGVFREDALDIALNRNDGPVLIEVNSEGFGIGQSKGSSWLWAAKVIGGDC